MTASTDASFSKRYRAALWSHVQLGGQEAEPGHSSSAQSLGTAAVKMGITPSKLLHIHTQALASLADSHTLSTPKDDPSWLRRSGAFAVKALEPASDDRRKMTKACALALRLENTLQRQGAVLARTKRLLRRALRKTKMQEEQMQNGHLHYSQRLAHSEHIQDQTRRLARQILQAQEEERREISRELHDEIAQILTGINVHLACLHEAARSNSQKLRQRISQTQRLVQKSVQIIHRYARELRPAMLDDLGLIPALRSYIKDMPQRKTLSVRLKAYPGVEQLDSRHRTILYRVAQEALTNVTRHAHASVATVCIRESQGSVLMLVHDNGRSFSVQKALSARTNKRLGLLGMRERVEMVGGIFTVESSPEKGTTVQAEIPFKEQAKKAGG